MPVGKLTEVKAVIGENAKKELSKWADRERRSDKTHAGLLLEKLVALRQTHREDLERLGLLDRLAAVG